MKLPIFVSYRRDDAAPDAAALCAALRHRHGESSVFMDVSSIKPGVSWPQELADGVKDAGTVLAVVGPSWLKTSDEWGRRRIDLEDDWVRREISVALELGKPIVPVLVRGATLPPGHILPPEISELATRQAIDVRRDYWEHDIELVLSLFAENLKPLDESPIGSTARGISDTDPFLVFEYDVKKGWKVRNIGRNPALNILVSERGFESGWIPPVRIPPLAPNQDYFLKWVHHRNVDVLGARYSDAENQLFSAVCQHDNSTAERGSVFPDWVETEIRAHWKV